MRQKSLPATQAVIAVARFGSDEIFSGTIITLPMD
jgi:hypothetical protein